MKQTTLKRLSLILVCLVLASAVAVTFAACNDTSSLEEMIRDLQEQVGDIQTQLGDKNITVYLGDYAISVTTREVYLSGALDEMYDQGRLTVMEADNTGYGRFLHKLEYSVDKYDDEGNYEETMVYGSVSDEKANTYIAVYHTIDNDSLKGTDYKTGEIVTDEFDGKTFWYSTLGISSLPVYDGAAYRFVVESY